MSKIQYKDDERPWIDQYVNVNEQNANTSTQQQQQNN